MVPFWYDFHGSKYNKRKVSRDQGGWEREEIPLPPKGMRLHNIIIHAVFDLEGGSPRMSLLKPDPIKKMLKSNSNANWNELSTVKNAVGEVLIFFFWRGIPHIP